MKVPLIDLEAQLNEVGADVRAAIDRVLASQRFVLGAEVAAFEQEVARYAGVAHAVGVSSGTDALLAALMALDVGPGDEVVTTPYTFGATSLSVARLGARPVFVDIDRATYAMSAERVDAAMGPRTRAILPVHLFGQMADMTAIRAVAEARGVAVVEDAAQAIGAARDDVRVGQASRGATLSFFPTKNLGAMGDAGMFITNDAELANRVRRLRNHGQDPKYLHHDVGGNFRLDELQAAILRAKLPRLDGWIAARQRNAALYRDAFSAQKIDPRDLELPKEAPAIRHVYHQFVVRTPHRERLRAHLDSRGIASAVYYPRPMHLQPCFASLRHVAGDFPESEVAARESLALPLYPELSETAIGYVVHEVASGLGKRSRE